MHVLFNCDYCAQMMSGFSVLVGGNCTVHSYTNDCPRITVPCCYDANLVSLICHIFCSLPIHKLIDGNSHLSHSVGLNPAKAIEKNYLGLLHVAQRSNRRQWRRLASCSSYACTWPTQQSTCILFGAY